MKQPIIFALLFSFFAIAACSKKSNNSNTAPKNNDSISITFANNTGHISYFDVYGSLSDYQSSINKIQTITMPPVVAGSSWNSELKISVNFIRKQYYIDYHDSSYQFTNWILVNSGGPSNDGRQIESISTQDVLFVGSDSEQSGIPNNDREILLKTTQSHTTWKLVNAYQFDTATSWTSIWGTLAAANKNMLITFNKNFTVDFTGADSVVQSYMFDHMGSLNSLNGEIRGTQIIGNGSTPLAQFGNALSVSYGITQTGLRYALAPPYTHSVDSIGIWFYSAPNPVGAPTNKIVDYIFVRQ